MDTLEAAAARLEAAWREGRSELQACLPPIDAPGYQETLVELAAIDLELAWAHGQHPSAESYATRFPKLIEHGLDELLTEEQRARRRADLPPLSPDEVLAVATRLGAPMPVLGRWQDTTPTVSPGSRLGPYRVLAQHARGGMGVVWRAIDQDLDRVVAIKTMARPTDEGARTRFLGEARLTATLEHPGVVAIHHVSAGERPYYAMKFVRGETLRTLIDRRFPADVAGAERPRTADRSLASRRLLETWLAVARAIAFAHERGVIHRDLKPENILVGEHGEVQVVDWGLARRLDGDDAELAPTHLPSLPGGREDEHTLDGTVLGTAAYMAPEQARGQRSRHDRRTDVYALGVMLAECVTGRRPTPGARSRTRGRLGSIITRATAEAPEARYRDAAALSQDVERHLADLPVEAHRERMHERLGRSFRRHRTLWIACLTATVVALGSGSWVLYQRHRDELDATRLIEVAAARDETLARANLVGGRPRDALHVLDLARARLVGHAPLGPRERHLEDLRGRIQSYAAFMDAYDEAWFLAGEERDARALATATRALDVPEPCEALSADLPLHHLDRCRRRRHRLHLLAGALAAKPALSALYSDIARTACEAAIPHLSHARALGPTAFGDLLTTLCATQSPAISRPVVPSPAPAEVDAPFYGLVHLWLLAWPRALSELVAVMVSDSGIDVEHPVRRAIDHLRRAVAAEPEEYWHHFMLGQALLLDGDDRAAHLVFAHAIALRPDHPRGYEARGLASVREGLASSAPDRVVEGRNDFERALSLAPDDPWTHWARAGLHTVLGEPEAAMQESLMALTLDPDGLWRALPDAPPTPAGLSTGVELNHAEALLASARPGDGAASAGPALRVALLLARGRDRDAAQALAEVSSSSPWAPTLRGLIALRQHHFQPALIDLDGSSPLSLAGRIAALEAMGRGLEAHALRLALGVRSLPTWPRRLALAPPTARQVTR